MVDAKGALNRFVGLGQGGELQGFTIIQEASLNTVANPSQPLWFLPWEKILEAEPLAQKT